MDTENSNHYKSIPDRTKKESDKLRKPLFTCLYLSDIEGNSLKIDRSDITSAEPHESGGTLIMLGKKDQAYIAQEKPEQMAAVFDGTPTDHMLSQWAHALQNIHETEQQHIQREVEGVPHLLLRRGQVAQLKREIDIASAVPPGYHSAGRIAEIDTEISDIMATQSGRNMVDRWRAGKVIKEENQRLEELNSEKDRLQKGATEREENLAEMREEFSALKTALNSERDVYKAHFAAEGKKFDLEDEMAQMAIAFALSMQRFKAKGHLAMPLANASSSDDDFDEGAEAQLSQRLSKDWSGIWRESQRSIDQAVHHLMRDEAAEVAARAEDFERFMERSARRDRSPDRDKDVDFDIT